MSTQLFPTLIGQGWSISRVPYWQSRKPVAISGKETAVSDWSFPRYQWTVIFNVLRQGTGIYVQGDTFTEQAQLMGFYNARNGGFDSFLYQDQDDNAASNQSLGLGDGSTVAFQLLRSLGGFVEPVYAPNQVSLVALGGVAAPWGGLAAPSPPSLSSIASGVLGGATYFVKITYQTAQGETLPSTETSLSVAANHVVQVASPSVAAGATGWNVYISTATNTEKKQNAAPIPIGTAFTEPNTGLIAGANPPATPSWTVSSWGAIVPGFVTFSSAPTASVAITASFTFYFPVRFKEDNCEFEKFMSGRYRVKKLAFMSIK